MDTNTEKRRTLFYQYTSENNAMTLSLSPLFRKALCRNEQFVIGGETLWQPGEPLPNPGDTYAGKKVTNYDGMFENVLTKGKSTVETLDLSLWDVSHMNSAICMFSECSSLKKLVGLHQWDTTHLKETDSMFSNCSNLEQLDLNHWNTKNLASTMEMFFACSSLKKLELNKWDTANLTLTSGMFDKCTSMETVRLNRWNTKSLQYVDAMFRDCNSLISVDISNWNTHELQNANRMFLGCTHLKNLHLEKWKFTKLWGLEGMFCQCASLEELILPHRKAPLKEKKIVEYTFYGCKNLKVLDLSAMLPVDGCYIYTSTFAGCNRLESVLLPKGIATERHTGIPAWTDILEA